jgi:hypothetical protein
MTKDKYHINRYIKHIFDENYADAKEELQAAVAEKLKFQMKDEIKEDLKENQ